MNVRRIAVCFVLIIISSTALAQLVITSTSELLAAIAAGGSHEIAAGLYDLPEPLRIESDLSLTGSTTGDSSWLRILAPGAGVIIEGGAQVSLQNLVLEYKSEQPGDIVQLLDGTLTLDNVVLSGARAGVVADSGRTYGYGDAIYAAGDSSLQVTNTSFFLNQLAAIELQDNTSARIDSSLFESNDYGIFGEAGSTVDVTNTRFLSHRAAVHLQGDATAVMSHISVIGNGRVTEDGALDQDAVRIVGNANVTISLSEFADNPRFALSVGENAVVQSNGNRFVNNGGYYPATESYYSAVFAGEAARLGMNEDYLGKNPAGAMELGGNSTVTVDGVLVEYTGSFAHTYMFAQSQVVIRNSRFRSNEGSLIATGSARLTMEDNESTGSGEYGIRINEQATAELTRNSISGSDVGIFVASGAAASMDGNTFSNNGLDVEEGR